MTLSIYTGKSFIHQSMNVIVLALMVERVMPNWTEVYTKSMLIRYSLAESVTYLNVGP